MSHLLDTNICAAHFRRPGGLAHRFVQYGGGLFIPTIVLAELYAGAYHVPAPGPLVQKIHELLVDVHVLDFDSICAEKFGSVRGPLLRQGISIPTADLMIAAVALVHNLTLVTDNVADFERTPGLRLDNWLAA
ncbi:MAG TPA: type II toxin-antitoxin system VapC family toxin [Pirellulales bacterium]|nr:type II toxin-antitoxin system VapC family toxin [Pirellulales bacterium]